MTIDLSSSGIAQDEAGRPFVIRAFVFGKRFADPVDVLDPNGEIQVVVRARLPAEQGVNPPASFDPDVDLRATQAFEDADDGLRVQLYCAWARSSPSASSFSTASAARATSVSASSSAVKFEST
jgi:hypothetical protein